MELTENEVKLEQLELTESKDHQDQPERMAKTERPELTEPQDRLEHQDTREAEESED